MGKVAQKRGILLRLMGLLVDSGVTKDHEV